MGDDGNAGALHVGIDADSHRDAALSAGEGGGDDIALVVGLDYSVNGREGGLIVIDVRVIGCFKDCGVGLGGLDAIVFTGGIGENDAKMRKRIIDRVKVLGADLDDAKNDGTRGVEKCLSPDNGKVAVWLIPTNEELMIARDAYQFVK